MKVVSFYRFTQVESPLKLRGRLQVSCEKAGLLGTVLLAEEGVNGTLAGSEEAVLAVFEWLRQALSLSERLEGRWTDADTAPFRRIRVKVKHEIVALGRPDIRPDLLTGQHVGIDEWNELISDPDTLVIDTRNHYEHEIGTFSNAIAPNTENFREFSDYAGKLADTDRDRRIAMFCTGGIRCEKAAALMLELGFNEVFQLQGGILKYLEDIGERENLWQGECFIFDSRVALDRDRIEGGYVQCHACRRPLSLEDIESSDYREGVSCPSCIATLECDRAERLEERRRQIRLSRKRGEEHIGATFD